MSYRIDYITINIPEGKWFDVPGTNPSSGNWVPAITIATKLLGLPKAQEYTKSSGGRFYSESYISKGGGITIQVPRQASTGITVQLSGMYGIANSQYKEALYRAMGSRLNITRIDIAFDVVPESANFDAIFRSVVAAVGEPRNRNIKYDRRRAGDLIGIGSRKSNYYLRIYDKAKELKRELPLVRFELEITGDAALAFATDIERMHMNAARKISSMLGEAESDIWEEITNAGKHGVIPEVGRKLPSGDGLDWYRKSVIPAIEKKRRLDPDKFEEIKQLMLPLFDSPHLRD